MEANQNNNNQRTGLNESKNGNKGKQLGRGEKEDCTISTEALGESRGVGDVIGRVMLWHQGYQ